jgi:tRNA A-37 threonylcarbamoyl transferase component Bud32
MSPEGIPKNHNTVEDVSRNTENNIKALETEFFEKVTKLPKEMAEVWTYKFEEIDSDDQMVSFINDFRKFLYTRELVLVNQSLEMHPDVNQEIMREILEIHESIKHTFGDQNYFLGNGATAEVYTLPIAPHLCVKYISDQNAYNLNNHMRKEYDFLDQLHKFTFEGIRTPHPYFLRIHPSEGHSYGMEKIAGENLSRILEEPEKNIELIESLRLVDREKVELSLISYITEMHTQFKITHNDLFKRNIMVDTESNFYIIDFGKARQQEVGEDHEMFQKSDIARVKSEVRDFFQKLDEIDIDDIMKKSS